MGRPPKNIKIATGERTQDEIIARNMVEDLFGCELTDDLKPSNRLNAGQKKIYKWILDNFMKVGHIGDLDKIMLEQTCIAIDRLQQIEKMINQDFELIRDKELMAAKNKYTQDLHKGVEVFGMSPIARAKMGILAAKKVEEEKDPLLKVLKKKKLG
jgi:P27 family predicted phage terminase small subunit